MCVKSNIEQFFSNGRIDNFAYDKENTAFTLAPLVVIKWRF